MQKIILLLVSFFLFFPSFGNAQSMDKKDTNTLITSNPLVNKKVIIIYGSPDCHHCTDTKKHLTDNKIEFIFRDIDHDKTAVQEMLSKLKSAKIPTSNLGIPVIDKYGEIFQNKGNFDDFLKKLIE